VDAHTPDVGPSSLLPIYTGDGTCGGSADNRAASVGVTSATEASHKQALVCNPKPNTRYFPCLLQRYEVQGSNHKIRVTGTSLYNVSSVRPVTERALVFEILLASPRFSFWLSVHRLDKNRVSAEEIDGKTAEVPEEKSVSLSIDASRISHGTMWYRARVSAVRSYQNINPGPKQVFIFPNKESFFKARSCQLLVQPPSWRTTPCRLSATAYSIHSQLHSILENVPTSAGWGFGFGRET